MPEYIGLQFLPSLDSYGVPFHAVVVFGLGFEFFFYQNQFKHAVCRITMRCSDMPGGDAANADVHAS